MTRYLPHTVKPLERWDHIAWRYYGSPAQYGLIIAANRDRFDPIDPLPEFLPVGAVIRVPIIDAARPNPADLPPWLRET